MNGKALLDVYYYIDIKGDVEFIERSLYALNSRNYRINKFVNSRLGEVEIDKHDIIKNGLLTFNKMFENLKLKNTNETWFFYISNGNIKDVYSNVFIILLNKNPREQRCFYVINKNNIEPLLDTYNNEKVVTSTICEVLAAEKSITYTNLT
jgi:hypothetical protein